MSQRGELASADSAEETYPLGWRFTCWSWREELNLQPAVYKTAALPLSYASQNQVGLHGLRTEPRKPNNCAWSCQAQHL